MKATGIVRRIDDLGRVVVPKEIRRTLRIREGDPLEIFVDRNGEIILKKYSPMGEMNTFAREYGESLYETTNHIAVITDKDAVIAVSGISKNDYLSKDIGELIEDAMADRRTIFEPEGCKAELVRGLIENQPAFVIAPIVAGGDPIGAVVLIAKDKSYTMNVLEKKMAETAASFLSKQQQ